MSTDLPPRRAASNRAANRAALADALNRARLAGFCLADCVLTFPSEHGPVSRRFLVEAHGNNELTIVGESIRPLELAALAQAFLVAKGAG